MNQDPMKKTAILLLKVAVSVGLFAYIFHKVDARHLWEIMRSAKFSFLVSAMVVYLVIQVLSAYRWRLLLIPLQMEVPFRKLLAYYFLGMYSNLFLPSAIGGDVVRIYYLNKVTRRLSGSSTSVFLDRDLGLAALLLIATVVAAVTGISFNGVALAPIFVLISVAFVGANLVIFYKPSYRLLHRLLSLLRMKKVDEKVERLFESVNSYRGAWRVLLLSLVVSILIQLGGVLVNLLNGWAIGLQTRGGATDYMVFIPAIMLIIMIPLSIGGLGWRELSFIAFFKSVGATEAQAVTLALLWFAVQVVTSLPGGIIYISEVVRKKEHISAQVDRQGTELAPGEPT
jgi:uncharacterized protein (TIRG00374 family)